MDAEDVVVDHDGEREEVEHVREVGPDVRGAVLADAFRVEAVGLWWRSATASRCARAGDSSDLGDCARFVVAADELDAVRVAKLQARQEGYDLDAEEPAVDVVACKASTMSGTAGWERCAHLGTDSWCSVRSLLSGRFR